MRVTVTCAMATVCGACPGVGVNARTGVEAYHRCVPQATNFPGGTSSLSDVLGYQGGFGEILEMSP